MSATTIPAGRTLHLVDIENLIGDPWATGPGVAEVYEAALIEAGYRPGDLVFVAANRWMLGELGFVTHTPCRLMTARGADGADLALLAQAAPEWVAKRFDRMVVASGDGIFAARAHTCAELGVRVDIVTGVGSVSRRLRNLEDDFTLAA